MARVGACGLVIVSVAVATDPKPGTPEALISNFIGMELTCIPAGEFLMGSVDRQGGFDDRPQHNVRITRAFWIGVYEVTQEEYAQVDGANPSFFAKEGFAPAGLDQRRCPAENMSWNEANELCVKLPEFSAEKAASRR